jgi:hypothetical protein
MEIIIVSSSTLHLADYWEKRLEAQKGRLIPSQSLVLCVDEDWPEGAGNGLGTLYAYQKARTKALQEWGIDIVKEQYQGASVALYHTAGYGKRLAPLTLCEHNNKPAVKLPSSSTPSLTILEAVIKQTLVYAPFLKSRLSVFWGDQLFFAPQNTLLAPKHHIAIFARKHPFPTLQQWNEKKWNQYGVISLYQNGSGQHIEKCDYESLYQYLHQEQLHAEEGLAISLGSFSLSMEMTMALLDEFAPELQKRHVKMDCETSIWMPLTLPQNIYIERMQKVGISSDESSAHYNRMQIFKETFSHPLFGIMDIGPEGYWWDYGTLQHYFENNLKVTHQDAEGNAMREFLELAKSQDNLQGVSLDENSIIIDSKIRSGTIKNSVLIGVNADHLDISNCILIQTHVQSFHGTHCLLYCVNEETPLSVSSGYVRADLTLSGKSLKIITNLERDGKADWNLCLPENAYSYEQLYQLINANF